MSQRARHSKVSPSALLRLSPPATISVAPKLATTALLRPRGMGGALCHVPGSDPARSQGTGRAGMNTRMAASSSVVSGGCVFGVGKSKRFCERRPALTAYRLPLSATRAGMKEPPAMRSSPAAASADCHDDDGSADCHDDDGSADCDDGCHVPIAGSNARSKRGAASSRGAASPSETEMATQPRRTNMRPSTTAARSPRTA